MDDQEQTSTLEEEINPVEQDKPEILLGPLIADWQQLGLAIPALLEKVKEAIASGANVNDDSRNGHRPLQLAIRAGYTDVACLLIECGADINYGDKSWLDPIHVAVNYGQFKVAKLLIKMGAHFPLFNPDLAYVYARWYQFRHFGG